MSFILAASWKDGSVVMISKIYAAEKCDSKTVGSWRFQRKQPQQKTKTNRSSESRTTVVNEGIFYLAAEKMAVADDKITLFINGRQ
mmetsp:Transcript_7956/g.16583  ORF Transcript_7956/g.16583 Transcript_7956/m.16583 type:complete len:86 (+) Transcript_7956:3641-3898(+)